MLFSRRRLELWLVRSLEVWIPDSSYFRMIAFAMASIGCVPTGLEKGRLFCRCWFWQRWWWFVIVTSGIIVQVGTSSI